MTKVQRTRLITGIAVLILASGVLGWRRLFSASPTPVVIELSGRIEGDESAVAPKTAGRILDVRVREGDSVEQGDILARLDDEQARARVDEARTAVLVAAASEQAARQEVVVLEQQLQASELQTKQAEVDAAGRVQQADADVAAAEADLARQDAANQLAAFDKDAYTKLVATGAASERQGRQAVATADQQTAAVAAARRRVEASRGALTTAKASLSNAGIRTAETARIREQIALQHAEAASAAAGADEARARLREATANLGDLTVTAPFRGTVVTRSAEPGEVVQAGTAIVTLVDLGRVYLRGFIPEGRIGDVVVGQHARVRLDAQAGEPLDAIVSRVDPQATFTPENTYFTDDRVKQVVGVKLLLRSAAGHAKPGMPADGEILIHGDHWPGSR